MLRQNREAGLDGGPVLVGIEYHVGATDVDVFFDAMEEHGRITCGTNRS